MRVLCKIEELEDANFSNRRAIGKLETDRDQLIREKETLERNVKKNSEFISKL